MYVARQHTTELLQLGYWYFSATWNWPQMLGNSILKSKWPHIVPDWHHIFHPKFMISCFCHVSSGKIKLSSKTFSSRFWLSCHRTWQGEHWNGIKNFGVSGSLQYLCIDNYTVYMGFTYLAIQEEDGDYMCRTAELWRMPQVDRHRNPS